MSSTPVYSVQRRQAYTRGVRGHVVCSHTLNLRVAAVHPHEQQMQCVQKPVPAGVRYLTWLTTEHLPELLGRAQRKLLNKRLASWLAAMTPQRVG